MTMTSAPVHQNHVPEGISAESWSAFGATRNGSEWHIPERDENGQQIGTMRRFDEKRYIQGEWKNKIVKAGGKRGLTMEWPLPGEIGTDPSEPLLLLEGQTDPPCARDRGFVAIGRPGANLKADLVAKLIKQISKKQGQRPHVAIIAENDESGAGKDGAEKLADKIIPYCASLKFVFPPQGVKDLREWCSGEHGADRTELMAAIETAELFKPAPADQPAPLNWHPYPVKCLPGAAADMVRGIAQMVGCEPVFAAMPALVAMAGLIGTTRKLMIQRGHYAPSVLWSAVIARSGTAKSPAADPVFEAPGKLQRRRMREYTEAIEQYQRDLIEHRSAVKAYEAAARKGEAGDPPDEPARPRQVRYTTTNATLEAICALLEDNPRGIISIPDELTAWLGTFDRYAGGRGGGDRAQWLSMYDAREVIVDRKGAENRKPIYVPNAAVSVYGTIQPGIASRMLDRDDRDSGLVARLLLVSPPSRALRWTGHDLPEPAARGWADLVARLLELEHDTDEDGELAPRLVRLDPEAKDLYATFYDEQADRWEMAESDDLAAAISKLRGVAARLALVIHLARWAGGDSIDPDMVDADSMGRAITLARWHTHEAERVYVALSETDEQRDQRRLIEWIEHRGREASVRDLTHNLNRYRNDRAGAEAALDQLVQAGFAEWSSSSGPGRPSKRCKLTTNNGDTKTPASEGVSGGNGVGVGGVGDDDVLEI